GSSSWYQRLRPDRDADRQGGHRAQRRRHRDRGNQRPHAHGEPGASFQARHRTRHLARGREPRREHPARGRPRDQDLRRARPRPDPLGRRGRGHRRGVHRRLHQPRRCRQAPRRRRQEGRHLRPGQGCGRHVRLQGKPRGLRSWEPPGGLQRLVHDQLHHPAREGAAGQLRHRHRLHDHRPRLHQRPEPARRGPQRPEAGPVGADEHRADLDGCRADRRRDLPGPQGQGGRHGDARPRPRRLYNGLCRPDLQRGERRRRERGLQDGRRGRALRRPRVLRGPAGLQRHRRQPGLLRLRLPPHHVQRPHRQGARLVRQRVGLLQPHGGPRAVHGGEAL
ncbi:MAG: NAD-dependent glyceraldehyde-3-phosphate dehydrogenase, partial [uncultured Rubrobacteraceae bacterium]